MAMILKILKWLGGVLGGIILLFLVIWFGVPADPIKQIEVNDHVTTFRTYEEADWDLDSLEALVGENKTMPDEYRRSILIALSHFPELASTPIHFKLTTSGAPMESSFDIATLFLPKSSRQYVIWLLETEGTFLDPIIMRNLSLDLQISMMAHELCHTIYYHDLSSLEVARWGLGYLLNPDFSSSHERNTDRLTVLKGFGWQLYDYAYYVRYESDIRHFYATDEGKWLDRFYMTDKEIMEVMVELNGYYDLAEQSAK